MTLRPAAYRLAQRKTALRQLQDALQSTLAADCPLDEKLLDQFVILNEIFLQGLLGDDLAGIALGVRAQRQGLLALRAHDKTHGKTKGKNCRFKNFRGNGVLDSQ